MRVAKTGTTKIEEADSTPFIDMIFQLIAFFMILVNFSDTEIDERVVLPKSQIVKPVEAPMESPILIQLTEKATVVIAGEEMPIISIGPYLDREVQILTASNKSIANALGVSEGTVKVHLIAVFRTLNVRNRTAAVLAAQRYFG